MKSDAGKTDSIWTATADIPYGAPLTADETANVCIVGAGIAGMTTAYLLGREGKSVIVVDDGQIGGGETGRTTAHLSNALDDRYSELERMHGENGARLAAESHTAAIDRIEQIVTEEGIDCGFSRLDGYLFMGPGQDSTMLRDELDAAQRAGLSRVKLVDRAPIPTFDTGVALQFQNQGQFHPIQYLSGLAKAIERDGGKIFTRTHIAEIQGGEAAHCVAENGKRISCRSIVVATNTPVNDWVKLHTKQEAYRTYVVGLAVAKGSVPKALYWDTLDPYHYVRLQPLNDEHDILIVGGEDHKTGQADDTSERFDRLESWARTLFPKVDFVEFRWSGQVMEPVDSLAFIGRNFGEENVYIVTGDSGHGMTHGTIAGMLLTDLIDGRENPWEKLYEPSRKNIHSIGDFLKGNLNVAAQYVDLVSGGDVSDAEQIPNGGGAVIRRGLTKIACHRDNNGVLHELSAICPHLGCVVDWNGTEKTWDCPCHGSRFTSFGKVINGPANTDLTVPEGDEPVAPIPVVTQ